MAVEKDAVIKLGVEGLDDVIRAAQRSKDAWTRASGDIAAGIKGAGKEMSAAFKGLVDDITAVSTRLTKFDLGEQVAGARKFREEVTRMAVGSGQDIGRLSDTFSNIGKRILEMPESVQAFAKSLGRATFDVKGAVAATTGLGLEALRTGKHLEEMGGLGKTLHDALGVTGDTTEALGKLRAQAEAMGTIGGVAAFHHSIEALSGTLERISGGKGKALSTSLIGAINGPNAAYNERVAGSILGDIVNDPRGYERLLGVKRGSLTDKFGHVTDEKALFAAQESRKKLLQLANGDQALAVQMGANMGLGMEASAALVYGVVDFDKVKKGAAAKPKAAPVDFFDSPAGKQRKSELDAAANKREMAEKSLGFFDKADRFAADHPILAAGGGLLAAAGLKWGGGKLISMGTNLLGRAAFRIPQIAAVTAAFGGGYAAGTWLDNKYHWSDHLASGGLKPELAALEANPEEIKKRGLSTMATIRKNMETINPKTGLPLLSAEEGNARLASTESQTQKLLAAAGYGNGNDPARAAQDQAQALAQIPQQTGKEFDNALRRSPIPVMLVGPMSTPPDDLPGGQSQ